MAPMSDVDIRRRGRSSGDGERCEGGVAALAEVEAIVLADRAKHAEEVAALRERIRQLEAVASANQRRLDQIEGAFASLSSLSKLWAAEADRVNSP